MYADAFEGEFVYVFVGISVGDVVCAMEEIVVGLLVGKKLGNVDGSEDGDVEIVGLEEGNTEGDSVGLDVGS